MLRKSPATRRLLTINLAVYLLTLLVPGPLYRFFALHNYGSEKFSVAQLVTYQFLHSMSPLHIIFNMMILVVFGQVVESVIGAAKTLRYYLACGVAAGLLHNLTLSSDLVYYSAATGNDLTLVGASGSVWGILAIFALMCPNDPLYMFFLPVAVRAKWVVLAFFAVELVSAFVVRDNVSHFAHVGGALAGLAIFIYERKKGNI